MKSLNSFRYSECAPMVSAETMRFLDNDTKMYNSHGENPVGEGFKLMKEAGQALYKKVLTTLLDLPGKSVAIFIGGGNNGGDGLALAKLMLENHIRCTVFSLAKPETFKNEASLAFDEFSKIGGQILFINDLPPLDPDFGLVVDCMLGNGGSGELRPAFARVVIAIEEWGLPVIAADVPTGFNTLEHRRGSTCISAKETLLFGLPRLDAFTAEGARSFGNVTVEPLLYPDELIDKVNKKIYLANENMIPDLLPTRDEFGNKRSIGCAMVIAGSVNMTGAPTLCAKGALKSGAGLVTLTTPKAILPILQTHLLEPVFAGIGDSLTEKLSVLNLMQLQEASKNQDAIAIGPGLGTDVETQDVIRLFLTGLNTPVVIDADAINACGSAFFCMEGGPKKAIITPHKREWERNFGALPASEHFYPEYLQQFATQFKITILLKGAPTYIATPDGRVYVVAARNSGRAKGGSGDILTGIIVSLLSQGLEPPEAAVLATLLHQKAGKLAREKLGAYSMQPTDVLQMLPYCFK